MVEANFHCVRSSTDSRFNTSIHCTIQPNRKIQFESTIPQIRTELIQNWFESENDRVLIRIQNSAPTPAQPRNDLCASGRKIGNFNRPADLSVVVVVSVMLFVFFRDVLKQNVHTGNVYGILLTFSLISPFLQVKWHLRVGNHRSKCPEYRSPISFRNYSLPYRAWSSTMEKC